MAAIDATMAERSERPLSAASWTTQLAVVAGLLISSAAHMALLGSVLFARPHAAEAPAIKAINVDLVPAKDLPPAPKLELPKAEVPKPELPKSEPPKPEPNKSEPNKPELSKTAPSRTEPLKTEQSKPVAAQPAAKAQAAPKKLPLAAERPKQTAVEPPRRQEPPHAEAATSAPLPAAATSGDAATAAARIAEELHLAELGPTVIFEPLPSNREARISRGEIAKFKAHLKKCWTAPAGVARSDKLKATIRITLSQEGRFRKEPTLLAATASIHGPALVKSALQALKQCQPYTSFPASKYKEWRLLDLNFTPNDILDIRSGVGFGSKRTKR